jgi:hypothetical protein
MGIQHVEDVTLIRHAYVRTVHRQHGIGAQLLKWLGRAGAADPDLGGADR